MIRHPLRGNGVRTGAHDAVATVHALLQAPDALAPVGTAGAGNEFGGESIALGEAGCVLGGDGGGEGQACEVEDRGEAHIGETDLSD